MAETIAIAASAAGIIGLADVACRLASTLFSFFAAVKNAPESVQNLVKELQLLQFVIANVGEYVTKLESTPRGVQLNISNDCLHSVLRECQSKLEALRNISMSVQDPNRDTGRVSRRLKWVLEEKKIKEHLAMVTRLKLDLLTVVLVAGKQHDLAIRDQAEPLMMELALIKDDLKGYLTESKSSVTLDINNIRELIDRDYSQVKEAQSSFYDGSNGSSGSINVLMTGQEEIVRRLKQCCSVVERGQLRIEEDSRENITLTKVANVNLSQQVLQNGKRSYRNARTINKSITQLRQQNRVENRQIKKLIAKIDHGRQVSGFRISSIQPTRHFETLEAVVVPLSLLRSSLYCAISPCLGKPTIDVPQEYLDFLVRQFEELLACAHVVSSQNIYRRLAERELCDKYDAMVPFNPETAAFVNSFVDPTDDDTRHFRRILHHRGPAGGLSICADVHRTKCKGIGVSFAFVPEGLGRSLQHGVAASFRYNGLSLGTPSITRSLREIRYIRACSSIHEAIAADNLCQVRELMAQGQVRPWDRDWEDRNLLVMAAFHNHTTSRRYSVLEYLLDGGWDFENADSIIWNIWQNFRAFTWDYILESPVLDIQVWIDVTRKCLRMGAPVDQDSYEGNLHGLCITQYDNYDTLTAVCRFLLEIGSNIEYVNDDGMTPLLSSAYNNYCMTTVWLQVLLENGADCNVVDYDLRNALHLALKKDEQWVNLIEDLEGDPTDFFYVLLGRLTILLQAGCSPWQVDTYGRTPGEYARESKIIALAWVTALKAAGQLDDEMLQLIANKPVKSIFDTEDEEDPFIADFDHRYWDHIMQAINLPSKPAFDNEEWIYVMEAFRSALKAETEREYLDGADPNAADFWYEQGDDVLSTDIETVLRLKAEERLSDATSDLLVANTVSFQDQPLDDSSSANPPSGDGMPASMETVLSDAPEPGFSVGGHQVPSKILSSPSAVSTDDAIVLGLHHLWI